MIRKEHYMENQSVTQAATQAKNPLQYLKIFFRHKWLFVTCSLVGLVIGIVACFLMPPTWKSSAIILVEEEKIINPLLQDLAVSTSAAQRMQSIREILLGWNSLVELAEKLNLAKDARTQYEYENFVMGLRNKIELKMRQPNIIIISYLGKDPKQTQLIAKTLTDILIEKNIEAQTKETDVALNFIKEQLSIYKRKIKESEISKLEDQLKTLLVDSTEMHPLVKELRQKIATAKAELESGDYQVTGTEQPIASPTRDALKQELDALIGQQQANTQSGQPISGAAGGVDVNNSIYKLLLMDKVDSSLARDMNINENIYNMLLQKLETAKITQRLETSREGTRYTIIDPPRLPLRPVKPNKAMLIFMGLIGGISVSFGLILAREFLDQSFLDIEEVKASLDMPILGAISRIVLQEEMELEKYKKKIQIIIGSIVAVTIIIAAALISLLRR